ncbi:NADH-quinone oxidoreductase subunit N [Candidatus Nitrospira bockiana]
MTAADFIALLPIVLLAGMAVIAMVLIAFVRRHALAAALSVLGCVLALLTLPVASTATPRQVTPLLMIDRYGLLFMGLILIGTATVTALAYGYLTRQPEPREQVEEFYVLLLLAGLGAVVLVAAAHFVTLFLGLELIGVSLYSLIGYTRTYRRPIEAAVKYLILSAASSAFLLFGMALLYFEAGTMEFAGLAQALGTGQVHSAVFFVGMAMIFTALGFKLAVVPFHLWTPDVYEGAPAPVTAFVATVSKGAIFAVLLRYVILLDALRYRPLWLLLSAIAVLSMFAGNLLALLQPNVKRLLAYSSIAHLGYLLVALLAAGPLAVEAVTFYLVVYVIMSLGAFGVVTFLSIPGDDADALDRYTGLFWQRPWLSGCLMIMLLALAGMPLTGGFLAKFYVIAAGAEAGLWALLVLLIVNSVIGVFYYLRVIVAMAAEPAPGRVQGAMVGRGGTWAGVLSLAALTILLVAIGVYPDPTIQLIRAWVGALA